MWTPPPAWLRQVWDAAQTSSTEQIKQQIPEVNTPDGDDIINEAIGLRKAIASTQNGKRSDSIYKSFPRIYDRLFNEGKNRTERMLDEVVSAINGDGASQLPVADEVIAMPSKEQLRKSDAEIGEQFSKEPAIRPAIKSPIEQAMDMMNKRLESQRQAHASAIKRGIMDDSIKSIVDNSVQSVNLMISKKDELATDEPQLKSSAVWDKELDVEAFDKPKQLGGKGSDYKVGDVIKLPEGHYWQKASKKNSPNAEWDGDFIKKDDDGYWVPVNDPRVTPVAGIEGAKDLPEAVVTAVSKDKYNSWLGSQGEEVRQFISLSEKFDAAEIDGEKIESTIGKYLYTNPRYASALADILKDPESYQLKGSVEGSAELLRRAIRKAEGITEEDINLVLTEEEQNLLTEGRDKFDANAAEIAALDKEIKSIDKKISAITLDKFKGTQFGGLLEERDRLAAEISGHQLNRDIADFNRIVRFSMGGATISDTDKARLEEIKAAYPGIEKNPEQAVKKSQVYEDFLKKSNRFNSLNTKISMAAGQLQNAVAAPLIKERGAKVGRMNELIGSNNSYVQTIGDRGIADKLRKLDKVQKYITESEVATSNFPSIYENFRRKLSLDERGDSMAPIKSLIGGAYRGVVNIASAPVEIGDGLLNAVFGTESLTGVKRMLNAFREGEFNNSISPETGGAMDVINKAMNAAGLTFAIIAGSYNLKSMGMGTGQAETLSSFMTTFPENKRDGINKGLSGLELMTYSTVMSAIEAKIEAVSPFDNMTRPLLSGREAVARAIKDVANGSGDARGIISAIKNINPVGMSRVVLPEQLEEIATGLGQGAFQMMTGEMWDKELNPDLMSGMSVESLASIGITTMLLRAPGAFVSPSAKTRVMAAAIDDFHNTWETITKTQRELARRGIDTAHLDALKREILEVGKTKFPAGLTTAQKIATFEANSRIESLESSKDGMNATMREIVDEQISKLKKQVIDIANSPDKAEEAMRLVNDELATELINSGYFTADEIEGINKDINEEAKIHKEEVAQDEAADLAPLGENVQPGAAQTDGAGVDAPGDVMVPGVQAADNPFVEERKLRVRQRVKGLAEDLARSAEKLYGFRPEVVFDDYDKAIEDSNRSDARKQLLKERAAGFFDPATRKIYINPKIATPETPIHEFGHLWNSMAQAQRPEIFARGLELIKGTEYEKMVREQYAGIIDEGDVLEEALAQAIGDNGMSILDEATRGRVQKWIESIVSYIRSVFGIEGTFSAEDVMNMSLEEFMDAVNAEMFTGEQALPGEVRTQEGFDRKSDMEKMMYIGERGGANMGGVVSERLRQAMAMESSVPEDYFERINVGEGDTIYGYAIDKGEYIRWSTGWFRSNIDGKWRYEIPLTKDQIERIDKYSSSNETKSLLDVLGVSKLKTPAAILRAHPSLKYVRVKFDDSVDGGEWSKYRNTITVGHLKNVPTHLIFAHELQHAIQDEEGFPMGSSPYFEKEQLARELYDKIFENNPAAHRELVELELQRDEQLNVGDIDMYDTYARQFNSLLEQEARKVGVELSDIDKAAISNYNRSAGEIEARNVEAREDFTTAEKSPLNESIRIRLDRPSFFNDVDPNDAIVRYRGSERLQLALAPTLSQEDMLDIENTVKKYSGTLTPSQLATAAVAAYPELQNYPEIVRNIEVWASTLRPNMTGVSRQTAPTQQEIESTRSIEDRKSFFRQIWDDIKKFYKKNLTVSGGTSMEFVIAKEKSDALMSHKIRLAESLATKMLKAIKNTGFKDNDLLDRAMSADTQAERQSALNQLPVDVATVAVEMRAVVDGLSRDMVINGYVTPSQAFTLVENEGKYFTRAYRSWEQPSWGNRTGLFNKPLVKTREYKQVWDAAVDFLQKQELKKLPATMPRQEALAESRRMALRKADEIVRGSDGEFSAPKPGTGRRDTSILDRRTDIPEPIRALMGEYTDPVAKFLVTVFKQSGLKANSDFLTALRANGLGKFFWIPGEGAPQDASYEVSSLGNLDWSPLNGLVTNKEVYEWLKGVDSDWANNSGPIKTWMKLVGMVRWGKTVGSISTQLKNFLQNSMFAMMNGHIGWHGGEGGDVFSPEVKEMFSYLAQKNTGTRLINELEQLDVIDAGFGAQELRKLLGDTGLASYGSHLYSLLSGKNPNLIQKGAGKLYDKLNEWYSRSDNTWKVFGFMNEASRYSKALYGKRYQELSDDERMAVNEKAAEITKNVYPTYSRVVRAGKKLGRDWPFFGNFISFRIESIRVFKNALMQGIREASDNDIAIKTIGFKRLVGSLTYFVGRSLANIIGAQVAGAAAKGLSPLLMGMAAGGDEPEREKMSDIVRFVAPWLKHSDLFILDNYDGTLSVVDMSSFDPYNSVTNAINAAVDARENPEEIPLAALNSLFGGFTDYEMTFATLKEISDGIDSYGNPIYSDIDTFAEKAVASTAYAIGKLKPGTFTSGEKLWKAWEKESLTTEISSQILGMRTYDIDVVRGFSRKIMESEKQMAVVKQAFDKQWNKPGVTEDERQEAVDIATERYRRIFAELNKDYQAALRLGGDAEKIESRLDKIAGKRYAGWSQDAIDYIRTLNDDLEVFKAPKE